MTRDRLVAIRRFFTYGEPCDPEITPQEIDVIFRMAEEQIEQHDAVDRLKTAMHREYLALGGIDTGGLTASVDMQLGISPYSPGGPFWDR